jgi:hyperosmotically inducible protein
MRWIEAIGGGLLLLGPSALAQAPATPHATSGETPVDVERARALETRLHKDPALRDEPLQVDVSGKRVRLSGTVADADERAHAEDVVTQSDPTLTVENQLQTRDEKAPPADTTVEDDVSAAARRAGHQAGKVASETGAALTDGWITSKIKAQLMATDGVQASAIDVTTTDRVVTLTGHVRSDDERQKVMRIVWKTHGVDRVVDQLVRAPGRR